MCKMTTRYVGIDVHKRQVVVNVVNAQQQVVMLPKKVSVHGFETWARVHLSADDCLALEATTNAWAFHDQFAPLVGRVVVANSHKIQLISSSPSKTDKHDTLVLAKLQAANLLPAVWVPPNPFVTLAV
jgi:transposase